LSLGINFQIKSLILEASLLGSCGLSLPIKRSVSYSSMSDVFSEPVVRGHWHDSNIVLHEKHWTRIPQEAWGRPHARYDERWKDPRSTILIMIAALRETRLPATLESIFDNAKYPDRVRVAVVQQNAPGDEDCIEKLCEIRERPLKRLADGSFVNENGCVEFDKVRVLRMDSDEAAGPVFARARQAELLEDEDFCMQIDAHSIFIQNWDVEILEQWAATKNEFAVLSTYPTNFKDLGKDSNGHNEVPHICGVNISPTGSISNKQAGAAAGLEKPLIAPLWAAGLSFGRCHLERLVPNDINLRHVFSGEEFSRGARLWTNGYDFYSLARPVIGVYYGSEKGGKGGWRTNHVEHKESIKRIMALLEFPGFSPEIELGRYGLGSKRTLDQYVHFSGVDTRNVKSEDRCLVKYVDWDDTGMREMIRKDEELLKKKFAKGKLPSPPHLRSKEVVVDGHSDLNLFLGENGSLPMGVISFLLLFILFIFRYCSHRIPRGFRFQERFE